MAPSPEPAKLTKRELAHLAELARIELDPKEEERFIKDLGKILRHFEELQGLDTSNVPPMAGGTDIINVFRGDSERENTDRGAGVDAFPEKADGYLKIPPVFEK